MTLWPWLILVIAYGACVGSFLNVVIFRLPEGKSIVHPPSSCPRCGSRLSWFDNVPVLAWLWLRGRCRSCREPISVQYPIIEAVTAALFALLFLAYWVWGLREDWAATSPADTWPVLLVHLCLVAALIAATVIDARLFIIPLPITWTAAAIALVVLPGSAWALPASAAVAPVAAGPWAGAAIGAVAGLAVSVLLLRLGVLPMSFTEEVEDWTQYPHPRREMLKELLFLAAPIVGAGLGAWLGEGLVTDASPPWLRVLTGVLLGYAVGGAIVWATRILGTLGFGREAMGLGDVHLLAAIGAVLGPVDAAMAFFIAPFFGLGAFAIMEILAKVTRTGPRIIPYGPHLAGAAIVATLLHDAILGIL